MGKQLFPILIGALLILGAHSADAQQCGLYPLSLEQRIGSSEVIVEGTVISQQGFWDQQRRLIYTSNIIAVHRILKGNLNTEQLEIITEGGTVGNRSHWHTSTLALDPGQTGIFFCEQHTISGSANSLPSYMVYGSLQGFIRFDPAGKTASEPFHIYPTIGSAIAAVSAHTNTNRQLSANPALHGTQPPKKTTAAPTITNFTPTTITAGTGSVLTINGTDFGASQGTGFVEFKNANDGGISYIKPLASDYVSWTDNQIQVKVPSVSSPSLGPAGSGTIRVTNSDPATVTSSGTLTITYCIINASGGGTAYMPYHYNTNGSGGYTFRPYSGFSANASALASFARAMNNWTCITDMNWTIGADSTIDAAADDEVNVVTMNSSLPGGILGRTSFYVSGANCGFGTVVGLDGTDIVFDDNTGLSWQYGPSPAGPAEYDFESVAVHELGHAHMLNHIIVPGAIMHYSTTNGQTTRVLSTSSDIAAGLFTSNRAITGSTCSGFGYPAMVPKGCPYSFRSAASGDWNSTGTWETSSDNTNWIAATVTPAATDAENVTIQNGHTVAVTQSLSVDQLTIDNGGELLVDPAVSLTVADGTGTDLTIASGGSLVLESDATGDARIAESAGSISGSATIQRHIPASGNRAWRLLAVPISSTGAPTIYNSWQEGGSSPDGYGTHITQASGAGAANSWDACSIAVSSSIRQYNNGTNTLSTPSGTNIAITGQPAWYLFVRGDRDIDINNSAASSNTTLRMTGSLLTGDQDYTVPASNFALIGNPYASPIDFSLARANGATTNTTNKFWVWDPKIGSVGGYVSFDGTLGYTPSATGGSYNSSTSIIQSGQGFFVKSTGTAGNFRIQEDDKASGWQNVYKTTNGVYPMVRVRLDMQDGSNPGYVVADGVIAAFDNTFSPGIDDEDGAKMTHFGPNLALLRSSQQLTIEKRPAIISTDTLFTNIWNVPAGNYQLQIEAQNFTGQVLGAWLIDNWLNTTTPLSTTGPNTISFSTTSASLSAGPRFQLVFQNLTPLNENQIKLRAKREDAGVRLTWMTYDPVFFSSYELQRSADGKQFAGIVSEPAGQQAGYSWLDVNEPEAARLYRVRGKAADGKYYYSPVVRVGGLQSGGMVTVFPNPVSGKSLTLQFADMAAGAYRISIFTNTGQLARHGQLNHQGGSATHRVSFDAEGLARGSYYVKIAGEGWTETQEIVVP